jgi:hypothetical protein
MNKGLFENLIRPHATTLVLTLVAHFGTQSVVVPHAVVGQMPSSRLLVLDNTKDGVICACCKFIVSHVCFLFGEHELSAEDEDRPSWCPRLLQGWLINATAKTRELMPQITLA